MRGTEPTVSEMMATISTQQRHLAEAEARAEAAEAALRQIAETLNDESRPLREAASIAYSISIGESRESPIEAGEP